MSSQIESEKYWFENQIILQTPISRKTFCKGACKGVGLILGTSFLQDFFPLSQAYANSEGNEVFPLDFEKVAGINLKYMTILNPKDVDIFQGPNGKNEAGLIGQSLSIKNELVKQWKFMQEQNPNLSNILFEVPIAATVNWEEADGGEKRIGMSNAAILEKITQSELIKDYIEKNIGNKPDSTDPKPEIIMTWQEYNKLLETEDENLNPAQQILKELAVNRLSPKTEETDGIFAKGIVGYIAGLPLSENLATAEEIRIMPEIILFAKLAQNGFEVHLVESTINTYRKNEEGEWIREEDRDGIPSDEHNLGHLITRPRIVNTNYGVTTVYENYQLDGSVKLLAAIKRSSDGQTTYKSIPIDTKSDNRFYPYIEASQGPDNLVLVTYRVQDGIKLVHIQPSEENIEIQEANIQSNMQINNVPANIRYIGKDNQGNNLYRLYSVVEKRGETSLFCQDLNSEYRAVGISRNLPLNGINGQKIKNLQTFLLEKNGEETTYVLLVIGEHTRGLRSKGYIGTDNGNEHLSLVWLFDQQKIDIFNFRIIGDKIHILTRDENKVFHAYILQPKSTIARL